MRRARNPLCRASDRIEARCTALLLIGLLTAGPLLAVWAASSVYRADVRRQEWDSLHRFRVEALVVSAAPDRTTARWLAPDGTPRTGRLPMRRDAGAVVTIWVDERGLLTGPPAQRRPIGAGAAVAAAVLISLGAGAVTLRTAIVGLLDRRRMRDWQAEWLKVEPRWSSRL